MPDQVLSDQVRPNHFDEAALRATWQTDLSPVICEKCDWRYLSPPDKLPSYCPHCFEDQLLPLTEFAEDLPYDRPRSCSCLYRFRRRD